MWPWAHVGAAYLLLAGAYRIRWAGRPTGPATLAVGVGAIVPDLIDKPLAWRLDVLPYGRTLAHSLVIGLPALIALWALARRYDHEAAFGAFALGYLAHLAGDAYEPFVLGEWRELFFLAWPLSAAPESGEVVGLLAHLQGIELTSFFALEVGITTVAIVVWWIQGRPGLATMGRWLATAVGR